MSINVNDKNLGHATAYAYYKAGGGTMTEAEFTEFMADFGTASQTAVEAAQAALASETAAQTAATTATNKASEATTAAQTATTKAGEASTSASTATSAKDTAVSASQTATSKASEATTAAATATSAKTDAVAANTAAQSAKTAAQTAQTGAETAAASVSASAAQIATNAADISQLKSEITDKSDTADMLKSFPTDTASGSVASFADGANVPVKSLIVDINPVQSGSGDPSPDNVRPISGWSEVNVNACGANVWDEEWTNGRWSANQGVLNPAFTSYVASKNKIPVKPQTTYYFFVNTSATTAREIVYYDINENWISDAPSAYANGTFTTPSGCHYINFNLGGGYGGTYHNDVSINYPPANYDYHPYSGQSINIQLGQTVYGGTLDVLSGELVIDRAMVDLGTLNFADAGSYYASTTALPNVKAPDSGGTKAKAMAEKYMVATSNGVSGGSESGIGIRPNGMLYVTNTGSAPSGSLVYELATPLTVQLTPHEVTALLGSNNVWADSGDSEVTYRADPTLYIGRLTEPDADMVADANITSGQYFMVGNTLYKATANIASGGAITPNVNCTRKSLSEALNELNA